MALKRPPSSKKNIDDKALQSFVNGAEDRQGTEKVKEPTKKKAGKKKSQSSKKKTSVQRPKSSRVSQGESEPDNYRFNILISESYHKKLMELKDQGISVQHFIRNVLYSAIDEKLEE